LGFGYWVISFGIMKMGLQITQTKKTSNNNNMLITIKIIKNDTIN